MQRNELVDAARERGDPALLIDAASRLPAGADRAFLLASARSLGADVALEPAHLDGDGALVVAREHLVRLDPAGAREWLGRATPGSLHRELTAFCDVLEEKEAPSFESLRRDARAEGRSGSVVELTALEALARAEESLADAEALARRGARMAATEALPDSAFLANVVLARLRRLAGRPHLATHILATLSRFAPRPWRTWIAWELALSFGGSGDEKGEPERAVRAASEGEVGESPALFGRDLEVLAALSDPSLDEPAALAFRSGAAHVVPRGLHGLAAVEQRGAVAWVIVDGAGPRRVLSLGLGALERRGFVLLPQGHRHRGRADTLLAACALAGPEGLDEAELFAATYGFPFVPELHASALGVTVHRARQRLEGHGELERASGRVRLRASAPLLLPDPRCTAGTEDRALQHIALGGTATARSIADALDVSLRSAQQALESLVAAGLCGREREGNAVRYTVEDTTFHEPTQARRRPI